MARSQIDWDESMMMEIILIIKIKRQAKSKQDYFSSFRSSCSFGTIRTCSALEMKQNKLKWLRPLSAQSDQAHHTTLTIGQIAWTFCHQNDTEKLCWLKAENSTRLCMLQFVKHRFGLREILCQYSVHWKLQNKLYPSIRARGAVRTWASAAQIGMDKLWTTIET